MKTGPVRLAIVLYAIWLILVGFSAYGPVTAAMDQNAAVDSRVDGCLAGRTDFSARVECGGVGIVGSQGPYDDIPVAPYALAAIAPPILLLIGWLVLGWVRRGFERDQK